MRFPSSDPAACASRAAAKARRAAIGFLALCLAAAPSCAQPAPSQETGAPALTLPVDCVIGETCLVQKLLDHDPGPGRKDYRCGRLTTDGHDGVDIRLRTMVDMQRGFAVVAAAAGTVLRTRDGEPDISSRQRTDRNGKDAGNAVIIDHGNGWESQYSHLRDGSVAVKPGQRVAAGERLGLIGMSGNSEFPHLHFSVRRGGRTIDPFLGSAMPAACSASASGAGLWQPAVARALDYRPTALIALGLASDVPPRSVAERPLPPPLTGDKAPILLWIDAIGAEPGDVQEFSITGPDGRTVHQQTSPVEGGGLSWFAYSGKRAPPMGWAKGRYTARYALRRNGNLLIQGETSGEIK